MKEEFVAACNNTTKSFNAIIQALQLSKGVDPSEVTRLLSFIDSIIKYYLQLDKQETIRYPIIYIPCAKDWAEEVCLEYVSYKTEITFDGDRMRYLENEFGCVDATRMGLDDKGVKKELEWRKVIKPVVRSMANNNDNIRNLIVCGQSIYNRLTKKQRLVRLLGDHPQTSIVCADVNTVKKTYADYKTFENIFCFYNNKGVSDKYEIGSLFNWTGLKNCFIFEFGSASYCLHNVLGCGQRLCDKLPHRPLMSQNNENIYPDFITLTAEEAHYLFNEEPQNAHTIIQFPTLIEEDKDYLIELYKYKEDDEWGFSIKDRNLLSLCLCQDAKNAYIEHLKQEKPLLFEDSLWMAVLELLFQNLPNQSIIDSIISFVGTNSEAAFVTCDAPDSIKNPIKTLFADKGVKIKFYHYKDLKDQSINERSIIVLCFCPHNLSSPYPYKNPNSFDDFLLNDNQSILDIINEVTIIDFSKYQYDYNLHLYAATNSQYRREALGGVLDKPQKPNIQYVSHYNELDDDFCERPQNNSILTIRFECSDGTIVQLPENEVLVCEDGNGQRFIESIRNLKEQDKIHLIKAIQPICELADTTMDIFFDDKRNITTGLENKIRNEYIVQGKIPAEHNHSVPIWKFLLESRIREYCLQNDLIKKNQQESLWQLLHNKLDDERIQNLYKQMGVRVQLDRVLRDWCDVEVVKPFAPLKEEDRENLLIHYLGLNKGFSTLYHRKQMLAKDMTRTKNSITEEFLIKTLFVDITDELTKEILGDSSFVEHLAIECKEDIETLKAIALEHINLRQVKSYTI